MGDEIGYSLVSGKEGATLWGGGIWAEAWRMRGREGVWKRAMSGKALQPLWAGCVAGMTEGNVELKHSGVGVVKGAGSGGQVSARFRGQQRHLNSIPTVMGNQAGKRYDLIYILNPNWRNLAFESHWLLRDWKITSWEKIFANHTWNTCMW